MGDMKKHKSLQEAAQEREQRADTGKAAEAVRKMTGTESKPVKDKIISAKVYSDKYQEFTRINQAQGITNNSALNMLINDYVRKNKGLLNED